MLMMIMIFSFCLPKIFGYKITNIINIAHEKEPVLNNKMLTNIALDIGSIAYIEKHNGHSENQVNFMLDNALTNHRIDLERLNAAKDLLHAGVSMKDADDILEATSKNFDMLLPIESYILNHGYKTDYDKKVIGVYDNHKVCDTKTVSVGYLSDVYNKNWEKLNARDKKLDAKFDTQSMLAHKYDAPNLD